jgi:hypothetical protein
LKKIMRRSERISRTARHEAMMGAMFLTAAIAAGVWAVAALQSGTLPGGTALIVGAAIALCLAWTHGREAMRLRRMCRTEAYWENLRSIRPRI